MNTSRQQKHPLLLALTIIIHISLPLNVFAQQHYAYVDILDMLLDLERLAVLPKNGEKCGQWSSYSRASRFDEHNDRYLEWDDNADRVGYIRQEDGGKVLAEMKGPGCIWRIWSASVDTGHVKVFLDGADLPAVDLPFEDYFNRTTAPFDRACLVYGGADTGKNNYIPIAYNRSCKIIAYGNWGEFFHFTYSTFPSGTTAQTFNMDLSSEESAALDRVDRFLQSNLGSDPAGSRIGEVIISKRNIDIPDAAWYTLADIHGEGVVTAIKIKLNSLSENSNASYHALRELSLSIFWDNEDLPSVWSPLGDFFGTAPGVNPYESLPMGMYGNNEFYAYWYMPFASRALIGIKNDGGTLRNIDYTIIHAALSKPISEWGRFHAKWNRNPHQLPGRTDRWPDWIFLTTKGGRGRFVGVALHVYRPTSDVDPNSGKGDTWWGEGDEKFFVDEETFPSVFGTGTEDYFGYAWGNPSLFSKAYHNQTLNEARNGKGNISLNRFHITDNIPFFTSIEGALEKYYTDEYARYAVTPYWYLEAGALDPYGPVPLENRVDYYEIPPARPTGVKPGTGDNDTPAECYLHQNHPNPFNRETTIAFGIPLEASVILEIFNVQGQILRAMTEQNLNGGNWRYVWDGTDGKGRTLSSGIYLYRLSLHDRIAITRKMVFVK